MGKTKQQNSGGETKGLKQVKKCHK